MKYLSGGAPVKRLIRTAPLLVLCLLITWRLKDTHAVSTYYVAQTAGTFTGGIDCNGHTAITLASANSLTLAPDDTVEFCGTISVATNTTALQVNQSGTSGNYINIKFDSGAVLTSPEWPADGTSGAINIGSNSHIAIYGNRGAGGYTEGVVQATNNGDATATCIAGTGSGGKCGLHGDSNFLEMNGGNTDILVDGITVSDMYVAVGYAVDGIGPNPGGGTCMYVNGNVTNLTVTHSTFHDMGWCISLQYAGTSSNWTFTNNEIYNIDHGFALGSPAGGNTLTGVVIANNNVHDYYKWDTTNGYSAQGSWHHDGVHIWGYNDNGSDTIQNIAIYNNTFGGCIGRNVTAHIFMEQNAGGTHGNTVDIYNNTLIDTCDGYEPDGLLTTGVDSGYKIYNNAFISNTSASDVCVGTSSSPSITFINNVVSGCIDGLSPSQGVAGLMYLSGGSVAASSLNHNVYAAGQSNCGGGGQCFWYGGSNWFGPFATWQSDTGQDASPSQYVSNALLNSNGSPQSGSAVVGNGSNLTSLCSGQLANLCTDINGVARPSSGSWDIGAFVYGGTTFSWTPTTVNGTLVGTNCGSGTYSSGTAIGSCTATPNTGYSLGSPIWTAVSGSAGCSGSTNPCPSFTLSANSAATANFTVNSYLLSTATAGAGSGSIVCTPSAGSVAYGTALSCTATPGTGSALTLISGCGLTQSGSTASGTMPANACTVTATFSQLTVAMPTFSPVAGSYGPSQSVTISDTTPSSTIYYTTNGSTPTTGSTVYSGPITVSVTTTVKAIAAASGYANSTVGSAAYTINGVAATPTFSPAGGTYTSAQSVTISDTTPSSTIHYTLDGSTPTSGSAVYTVPLNVSTTTTVKAIAIAVGYTNSAVGSATYTISLPVGSPNNLKGAFAMAGQIVIP